MSEALERAAADSDGLADRLERAARHLRVTAGHFRAGDVPRACAHVLAAEGELVVARRGLDGLDGLAERHAGRARA